MANRIPAARINCVLTDLVDMIGGRWKVLAMWRLMDGSKRFTELRRLMPGVTQKMLTQQLRQLEDDGLVDRKVYPQVPPKVEYSLTATGEELCELLKDLAEWAKIHMPSLAAGKLKKAGVKREPLVPTRVFSLEDVADADDLANIGALPSRQKRPRSSTSARSAAAA